MKNEVNYWKPTIDQHDYGNPEPSPQGKVQRLSRKRVLELRNLLRNSGKRLTPKLTRGQQGDDIVHASWKQEDKV